jgi:3D (Asp-Asp-Asp) domain-containing protein
MLTKLPLNLKTFAVLALILITSLGGHKADPKQAPNLMSLANEPEQFELLVSPELNQPRVMLMEVTAYCPCKKCCGPKAQGITASGKHVSYNAGKFVAADTKVLPFGTKLDVPGYGSAPVEVIDKGGAIKGNKLDVFFPTHQEALKWGRQWVNVTVVE